MARQKKTYQTPIIEKIEEPVKPTANYVEPLQQKTIPVLIAKDNSVAKRRVPTIEPKHIAGYLTPRVEYKINKVVHSIIYGDFYLLENGFYIMKVGNIIVKE